MVDDPAPSPGDTVNFTITSELEDPADYIGLDVPMIDTKVDVELTGGLTVSGTQHTLPAFWAIPTLPTCRTRGDTAMA